jgi:DtxR family transcriptional regulator, Mn-dependent transcriptional regulator
MMLSYTEENYLKAIYRLSAGMNHEVSTNSIAEKLQTKASSVTDMMKKLASKKLINYKKYQGVTLSAKGQKEAIKIVRKHRLWEVFLVEKLKFGWDEVHSIAEQLEHIQSEELIKRLDEFLGNPQHDPHGDPIPDEKGNINQLNNFFLSDLKESESGIIVGVKDSSSVFLQYLHNNGVVLGIKIKAIKISEYDNSTEIMLNGKKTLIVSEKVARNLYVKKA